MNRFFGMMPVDEIEIERTFVDENDLKATIQAGKNGWSVLWDDCSSDYADVEDTAQNNYQKALDTYLGYATGKVRDITPVGEICDEEICDEEIGEVCGECDSEC